MRNDRASERRRIRENDRRGRITWGGFCDWFDEMGELDRLNFLATVKRGAENLEPIEEMKEREERMSDEDHNRYWSMVWFAVKVLEKLGM